MQAIGKLVFLGAAALGVAASFPAALAQTQVVPPRPREQAPPAPPANRFGMPVEGWVVLRYTVLADGRTANVRAIDTMPPQLSDREAVAAVKEWTFEPATAGGEAVEWHNNESVVVFDDESMPSGPTPPFLQAYQQTAALIQSGEHDKALKSNERMLTASASRLVEFAIAQVQNTVINIARGDLYAAYAAIVQATDPRIAVLAPDDLKVALQYRNVLELQLGDAAGALATFERRNALEPVPSDDAVAERIAAVEAALGGETAIVIAAKIFEDVWRHTPSRRTFAISDVVGDVRRIDVECDRGNTEIEYAPDSEWTLPASWGACSLAIEGRDDTEFRFYEFP